MPARLCGRFQQVTGRYWQSSFHAAAGWVQNLEHARWVTDKAECASTCKVAAAFQDIFLAPACT